MKLNMKKYFKIIGWILIIFFIADFIYLLVVMILTLSTLPIYFLIFYIILLLSCLFFGPALGLLFLYFSYYMEDVENISKSNKLILNTINYNNKSNNVSSISNSIESNNTSNYSNVSKFNIGTKVVFVEEYHQFRKGDEYIIFSKRKVDGIPFIRISKGDGTVVGFVPRKALKIKE